MEIKERDELQRAWLKSSKEDYKIAEDLIDMKHYQWALFLCHIAIEKVLKASYIKINDQYPPPIHKLVKLATDCKIELSEEQVDDLREMTSFNIEARYDIIKDKLYKKATKEYTKKYFQKTKNLLNYFISLI
ncbi:DNA-binding protein [Candidatus Roizmanbacteria bacterium CG_4_8_14_3_um_filter_34_9]|uniref:DNA-binding protein n=3 Tax=Candidatus Roizmaniibacteriota TaxID=1752723 RepID=A0A2M7AUH5_9BACT|nr:MAG: DNA-binding protein [Candidatus Roizmanbacteria bacterium CG07_land_8_20_14_0_80_34_15]PIU74262.1 MAG: DNA-binding protein [Candidatus Roizmanbacteria bacterium CG06_land_8_20_14_3_00_34_14]PIW73159.1 MAG: DNA-binding protein [Candidatus Roizmanbacteria bacterium CG_4_8_14_3_um_filter_34_9]